MMPGETHSKTAGIASEAAGSCQNCTSLQQSLNEYVAALITVKQKIIDSDQLLTEYQRKCDDLQYAERENETLRCQLEQMLQKISTQKQHEDELKSLKTELEEKTSTLKIYQQTELEYIKVKEECQKSDIAKKKLEVKLKKMEEAAAKHDKDFKQLKVEKKVIGKELKKIQKMLDGVQSKKNKKVAMKNAQTQYAKEEPVVKLDKQKIRYLLEEIWGCIESSTENGECNLLMLGNLDSHELTIPEIKVKKYKRSGRKPKNSPEYKLSPNHSRLKIRQTCNPLAKLDEVQATLNLTGQNSAPYTESAVVVSACNEHATLNVLVSKEMSDCSSVNSDFESDMDEILEVQNWAKPLPNLLSPIQCSPLTMKNVFGELTDSSDAESTMEMDQSICNSQLKTANFLQNGTDKNRDLNAEVEHCLLAADNVTVKTTVCFNDGPDRTMEMETTTHNLEQTTPILPLQKAQQLTEDPIHMKCDNTSDHLTSSTTYCEESLTYPLKRPKLRCENSELSERPLSDIENVTVSLDAENEIQYIACHTDKNEIQLDNQVNNSATNELTACCNPSLNITEPDDDVGRIKLDNLTGNNPESPGCFISSKSPINEDSLFHCDLNSDKDVSISVGRSNVTILDCDQEIVLPMQSKNCSEKEKSSSLTDLHTKQDMSDDGSTLFKDAKCFNNSGDVDLSKCSEEDSGKTLDTVSTLSLINNFTEETEQLKRQSTEKNCSEYILPGQLRHTSPLHISSNHLLTVSDCRAHVIDCENMKENSIYKSGDLEVPADMLDKQNIMDVSLNERDSIMDIAMESQCKTIHKKGGLEKSSSQKENILELEKQNCCGLGMDKMASTSLFHSSDQCEVRSPETDNLSSTLGLDVPLASPADVKPKTVLDLPQVDTWRADCASSPKPVICDDHLFPPIAAHLNDQSQPCINTITDTPTHHPEKCNNEVINLPSVVSPVHMAVDSEHTNKGDRLETRYREVTESIESSMDLNSSILEQRNTIFCPLSKAGLIAETASSSSKVMPVVPLEKLQHLLTPSESKDSFKKLEDNTKEICDASLESSESEYEFPVRKVNFTRSALNNMIVRNEPLKPTSDAVNGNIDNGLLIMTELEEQHKPSTLAIDESNGHVTTVIEPSNSYDYKVENDILIEPEVSVLDTQDTESTNSVTSKRIAVECSPEGKTKEASSLEDPVRQNDVCDDDRSDKDAEKNNKGNSETRGRKSLSGKNLIWNFSRSVDDFVDHRAVCLTHNRKTSSEDVSANLENSVSRGSVSTAKTQENHMSSNLNFSKFLTARTENPPHRLQGETASQNPQVGQTVLANADTSTNTGHSPETINKVRSEMGPPLPPLLGPLLCTPPRSLHTLSPIMSSSSRSSLPSPLDEMISPLPGTPFPPLMSPLCDRRKQKSPVFNTPSPAEKANRRILSSPLQFCAATPKHAVPVPGRLPLSANGSSTCSVQENSVKILDTMYPELSARARTLNILKGNVQLNRGMAGDSQNVPVSQITGFKSITSTSTVFIKTGSNSKTSNNEKPNTCETQRSSESCTSVNKRVIDNFQMPKSAKRLRLDSESPVAERIKDRFTTSVKSLDAQEVDETCQNFSSCESLPDLVKDSSVDEDIITNALKKVEELCFDLLPVIRSHVYVGTIPNVPVMRNEEKEVIYDFSSSKKGLADSFLHVLLKKIKTGKRSLDSAHLQALCRVYVGLCRQLGDIERARILCYSILKEDFPDPDKLLLFVISSWNDILSVHGVVSKAIQAVLKNLGKDEVGSCLSAYLNWKKSPPMNISVLLNSVLMAIQLYPDVKFCQSEKYGEDLIDSVWEYVFAVDLLCSQRKWTWTNENVISKELWPILDKWVKRKKGNLTIQFVPDIIVATVLRLIGHLCQMGLKEGFITAVKNITSVIITFIKHANEEGVPWGVQLASVYMLCDTAPCDPNIIHQTLQAWKETTKNNIPPAVINCMQEIASLCVQDT